METIRKKLEQGSYSSSTSSFYRDILLLFTNAIVFFPDSSPESLAAHELRTLVLNEIKKQTQTSDTKHIARPEPDGSDSLLARQKRSSVSSSLSKKDDKEAEETSKEEEKIVTVTRSSRRNSSKGISTVACKTNNKMPTGSKAASSNDNGREGPNVQKKTLSLDKKKSVADFLKRIKSSPANSPKKDQNKNSGNGKKDAKVSVRASRSNNAGKKKTGEANTAPLKKNTGRQPRKAPGPEPVTPLGKRGRETTGSGSGKDDKQPKKRSRR